MNTSSSAEQHTTTMAAVRQVEHQNTVSAGARSNQPPLATDSSAANATLNAIALLQHRLDANDQRTTSNMASLNASLQLLESRTQAVALQPTLPVHSTAALTSVPVEQRSGCGNQPAASAADHRTGSTLTSLRHNAPEQLDRYYCEQPRLESQPRAVPGFGEDRNMALPPHPVRRAIVGPDDDQIPPALGPTGGAGSDGFEQQARNPFLCTTPSDSDRARWRATEDERERIHEHARQLAALPPQVDYSAQARGRNAGSGVSGMQGRGDGLPPPWASQVTPATLIIGWGCAQFH